jgi:molybdopterin-guanine dinucleotide biosynthesis protein B
MYFISYILLKKEALIKKFFSSICKSIYYGNYREGVIFLKLICIVGYQASGKTTLAVKLAQELTSRGYKVAVVKHAPQGIDMVDKDTYKYKKAAQAVVAISDNETALFLPGRHSLEDMLKYLQADYVIVEGFKREKNYPKILCLKEKSDLKKLSDGLEIAAVGKFSDLTVPVINDINKLCDLIEQKSFKLPNLNCGECGFDSCYELAKEIVKGKKSISDCTALLPNIEITINDTSLPLNQFAQEIIRNTIKGMLSVLKGYKHGDLKIEIPVEKN